MLISIKRSFICLMDFKQNIDDIYDPGFLVDNNDENFVKRNLQEFVMVLKFCTIFRRVKIDDN